MLSTLAALHRFSGCSLWLIEHNLLEWVEIKIVYSVYGMKNIVVRDEVYELLSMLKDKKSFSDIILELIEKNSEARKKIILRYFGVLDEESAKKLEDVTMRERERFRLR